MNDFTKNAMRIALARMFEPERYFDITVLDTCAKLAGVTVERTEYDALRLLHCVHWKDMPREMRAEVFARTMAILGASSLNMSALLDAFEAAHNPPRRGFLARIGVA